jgi:alpha-D-ribose 1-methylphosphonate 5-triphosphate diphosphatase
VYLTHANILLPDQIVEDGALQIEDAAIAAINPEGPVGGREVDLRGAILAPGIVDLHCDALEKEVEPRTNVRFPTEFALREADKRNALAGVTTPFHALSFAGAELGVRNNRVAGEIVRDIRRHSDGLMVDHRVHCRYEMTDPDGIEIVLALMEEGAPDLVSFMDHTPGQGQFRADGAYEAYLRNTYGKSEEEARQLIAQKGLNRPAANTRVERLAERALLHGIPLASHDDHSPERIDWMRNLNGRISEFPINLETARAARKKGIKTMFGAPNVLRGESQSGSMRALDGVEHGVIDILCSDYHPGTMLPALFLIAAASSWSLPQAFALATTHPARAVGMHDRGIIEVGKRADLIAIREMGGYPEVIGVWINGRPVWNRFQALS